MYVIVSSLLLTLLLLSACNGRPAPVIEPAWVYKPNIYAKTGAVGSSKPHYEGKTVQRRLAISRALDELAQQSGVEVGNIIMRRESSSAIYASSTTQIHSTQSSSGNTINAHIEEVWVHPKTKEMFVWLLAD